MKLRDHIVLHYTVVTFVVLVAVSAGLGWILTRQATDYLIRSHIELYPQVIQALVARYPETHSFLESPAGTEPPAEVRSLFREILSFGAIFRIKIWGADGTILWSDKPELVGRSFADNLHFQEAMLGRPTYELSRPHTAEDKTERGHGKTLEIYTPLFHQGRCIGVFELYESDRDLHSQIGHSERLIWGTVVGAGALLYILLFLIFYRSYLRQRHTSEELAQTQDATIFALAYQAELRDMGTGRHLERTSLYVRTLAEELRAEPVFRDYLTDDYIDNLSKSAPLHDIGKVGITDAILCKPDRLSEAERREMKQHPELGADILSRAEEKLPFRSFLRLARHIALYHHERWDGEGYPFGLKGDAIPLSARIMALADVYDALRSRRHYKMPVDHEVCVETFRQESGRQFDPRIVAAFLRREDEFRCISEEHAVEDPAGECEPAYSLLA